MNTPFAELKFISPEKDCILAKRFDGSHKTIEPSDVDLWALAASGSLGFVHDYVPPPEPDLEDTIAEASSYIDRKTGNFRTKFITDIPGQAMVYLRKKEVAEAFLSQDDPDLSEFPRIAAAVGVVAETPKEVAMVWVAKAAEWEQLDILIESRREIFKKRVREASTKQEIEEILKEFKDWSV